MATADMVLTVKPDLVEFEISICKARYELAESEMKFWAGKLADAITKRG